MFSQKELQKETIKLFGKKYTKKDLAKTKKWLKQRALRGWADCDVWSIDGYLSDIIPQMIRHYAKMVQGYPTQLSEKKWQKILQKIVKGFEDYLRWGNLEHWNDTTGKFDKKKGEKLFASYEQGFELFKTYFYTLWD